MKNIKTLNFNTSWAHKMHQHVWNENNPNENALKVFVLLYNFNKNNSKI